MSPNRQPRDTEEKLIFKPLWGQILLRRRQKSKWNQARAGLKTPALSFLPVCHHRLLNSSQGATDQFTALCLSRPTKVSTSCLRLLDRFSPQLKQNKWAFPDFCPDRSGLLSPRKSVCFPVALFVSLPLCILQRRSSVRWILSQDSVIITIIPDYTLILLLNLCWPKILACSN